MSRTKLTDEAVRKLNWETQAEKWLKKWNKKHPDRKRTLEDIKTLQLEFTDRDYVPLYLQLNPGGTKTWRVRYYGKDGGTAKLGRYPDLMPKDAREKAQKFEPSPARTDNEELLIENVVSTFIERYAKKRNRKHWPQTQRIFDTYVLPEWRGRSIFDIKRRAVIELLDKIEDGKLERKGRKLGGPAQADAVLAAVRKLMNWYAVRDEDYSSPIVRGMKRTDSKERARKRVLSDDEIRALWTATDIPNDAGALNVYCATIRTLLLTAQRRGKVAGIKRSDINDAGVWNPVDETEGANKQVGLVPLSQTSRDLIASQPIIDGSDFVFSVKGRTPFNGWGKSKHELDERMLDVLRQQAEDAGQDPEKVTLPNWRVHDLRRTAKTLMMRAAVRPDISERVLGHVIAGVEGVYDQHTYLDEKADALEKLAALIDRIINPTPTDEKIVSFPA